MKSDSLFDRSLLRLNRKRSAASFSNHNFLHHEVANRMLENLSLFNRSFESVLEIGSRDGYLSELITSLDCHPGECRGPVGAPNAKKEDCAPSFDGSAKVCNSIKIFQTELYHDRSTNIIAEDELLPFKPNSFDLVVSNLNLHFINQIPQFLLQVKNILKPGGVFIASFFGEENLSELARVLYETENEIYGGISPRMPPTIDVKTAAALLAKAGFQNPISDFEKIEVSYSDPLKLLQDLKKMGQGNILTKRSRLFFTKQFLKKVVENYFFISKTEQTGVRATFEVVTIAGIEV